MQVFDPTGSLVTQRQQEQKPLPYSLAERYFQLEELEDRDTATTELRLNWDNTVTVGVTDGPRYSATTTTSGTWHYDAQTHDLQLILQRTYPAGHRPSQFTDMGEFEYTVDRILVGHAEWMTNEGDRVHIVGSIHNIDDIYGEEKVGYFHLIDTTPERLWKNPTSQPPPPPPQQQPLRP
jgi:hypothetical protein